MTISRAESRRIVLMLSVPNRFRLMFGQPFFPGPDVDRYEEAMKAYSLPAEGVREVNQTNEIQNDMNEEQPDYDNGQCRPFPHATESNVSAGWILGYSSLEEIQEMTESNEGGLIDLEDIQIIILALRDKGYMRIAS